MRRKKLGKRIGIIALVIAIMLQFQANDWGLSGKTVKAASTKNTSVAKEKQKTNATKKKKKKKKIKLSRPKVKVKRKREQKVKFSWKKVKKAKSYIIYKKEQGKKFRKIYKTSRRKFVDTNTKGGKKYYYRVMACRTVHGKTVKSRKSKTVKVVVKAVKKEPKKLPKNEKAEVVICGECYVEGMDLFAKSILPKNYRLVYKVGISTYGLLNTNHIPYNGMTLTAVERIAYYHPKRVFFLVGMNEAANPNPKNTINNYKKIISLLKSVNPKIEIVLISLPPVGRNHVSGFANNNQINKYNAAYKKLAKKKKNVYYYDGYRKKFTDSQGYLKSYADGGDGGHWSSRATVEVLKKIIKYEKKLAKEKR